MFQLFKVEIIHNVLEIEFGRITLYRTLVDILTYINSFL